MLQQKTIVIWVGLSLAGGLGGCETIYRGVTGAGKNNGAGGSTAAALAPTALAAIPACPGNGQCFSVLAFNMKHRDIPLQLNAAAAHLKAQLPTMPDFILCQEVVFDRPRSKGVENTAMVLAEYLGYEARGTARDGGDEGVAILSRHRFDHYDHLHIHARDALLSGGFPRVSVMAEFTIPDGKVRVVNVHLTQRLSQHEIRAAQLQETLDWMAERQRQVPADIIVLGGDFNIEPQWNRLGVLKDAGATGGVSFLDFNTRENSAGNVGDPWQRVDYIFVAGVNRTVSSIGEAILWREGVPTVDGAARFWPSDHLPLLHVFAVSGK
jgi:endonuclease/exonuclease/phosphatase family metal-dependent hydrolase